MKKIGFLAFLAALTVSLTAYCQDYDDEDDDWPLQCIYPNIRTASGCDVKLINSLRDDKEFKVNKGTLKVSMGSDATIHYKRLESVVFGLGSDAVFADCVKEPALFVGLKAGSDVKFRQGVDCKTFYAELGAGSELKINEKATIRLLIFNLGAGCEVKINDLIADTLIIIGSGIGSEVKINGKVETLIYCKDFSAEIRGRFRPSRVIDKDTDCKQLRKEIKRMYESMTED